VLTRRRTPGVPRGAHWVESREYAVLAPLLPVREYAPRVYPSEFPCRNPLFLLWSPPPPGLTQDLILIQEHNWRLLHGCSIGSAVGLKVRDGAFSDTPRCSPWFPTRSAQRPPSTRQHWTTKEAQCSAVHRCHVQYRTVH